MRHANFAAPALAALTLILFAGTLAAQDSWEPNNAPAQSKQIFNHVGQSGWVAGFGFSVGTAGTNNVYESLTITAADQDWFTIPGGAITANTTLQVFMNQAGFTAFRLAMQVTDSTGATVLSGPGGVGVYSQFDSSQGALMDGARCQINAVAGTSYLVRIYYPTGGPTIPSGTEIPYDLSIEMGTTDSAEGTYSNNFPGFIPTPFASGAANAADATPTGPGVNKAFTGMSWRGYDYYMVNLGNTSAAITVTLNNLAPSVATYNFDVYWVDSSGALFFASGPGVALEGAADTFPNGWTSAGPSQVTVPNTSEVIVTPPLTGGVHYFHVMVWDLSGTGITVPYVGGTYNITFSYTAAADDAFEQNDDASTAATIGTGTTSNLKMLGDVTGVEQDWYKINVANGENLDVRMTLSAPGTDNLNIYLYQPNTTAPGQATDMIDMSAITNQDAVTKGATTATEMVGTWGTVGPSGSTGLAAGEYYIRVTAVGIPINGTYSLTITKAGTVDIGPEDNREPNDNIAEASDPLNTANLLLPGMNTNLKMKDFNDQYKFQCNNNATVEVTMYYDGSPSTDLDLLLVDLAGEGLVAQSRVNENSAGAVVTVTGTAGDFYRNATPPQTPPNSGMFYVAVQRWASVGATYALNLNVNGANPAPKLNLNSVTATPGAVTAPNSTTVNVSITNTDAVNPVTLNTLALTLTHSGGANVTSEYTITGPTPTLPFAIPASGTQVFAFTVTSAVTSTNGVVTVSVAGTVQGGGGIAGTATGTFTLSGGTNPSAVLVYQSVTVSGNLKPGGSATVRATVRNNGTLGGTYNDPASITFMQGASDITANFTQTGTSNPVLPQQVNAGQSIQVTWTFAISNPITLGAATVTITGGAPDNPATPGTGNFNITVTKLGAGKGGGGGCATGTQGNTAWLLLLAAPALLLCRRRKA